jgi:hypothetical protein
VSDIIRIRREELFAKGVEEALARDRQLRGRRPELPPVSPLRALLLAPLVHLPVAGGLAALIVWLLINPHFEDAPHVAGEILLVNRDPFDVQGTILTLGDVEVVVADSLVRFEPGRNGEPPLGGSEHLEAGAIVEVVGTAGDQLGGDRIVAIAIRPISYEDAVGIGTKRPSQLAQYALFPLTAVLIALALVAAEGAASRNWMRMMQRSVSGAGLTLLFSLLAYVPAGMAMTLGIFVFESSLSEEDGYVTADTMKPVPFLVFSACRGVAWACIGAALGLGMNIVRATKVQLRNSVVGGALGGALGGAFFDPIERFVATSDSLFSNGAEAARLVGLVAVGVSVGFFVALAEHLAREAWVLVRTGPLAGKSFVLYRTPTTIGSAPETDVYLFKDAELAPRHAAIHRLGNRYEIEDLGSRAGVVVGGRAVRRHRLASGDQIVLGATVLDFEERARKP